MCPAGYWGADWRLPTPPDTTKEITTPDPILSSGVIPSLQNFSNNENPDKNQDRSCITHCRSGLSTRQVTMPERKAEGGKGSFYAAGYIALGASVW